MNRRQLNKTIREITAHLQTPEGKASLKKARDDAQAFCEEMRRKRAVPWWTLWGRVTI